MVFPQKVNWFILYQSADKMASIFLRIGNNQEAGGYCNERVAVAYFAEIGFRLRLDILPATQKVGKHRDYDGQAAGQAFRSLRPPNGVAGKPARQSGG